MLSKVLLGRQNQLKLSRALLRPSVGMTQTNKACFSTESAPVV